MIDGDELYVYVVHEVDELEELPAPTSLLACSDPVNKSLGINAKETMDNEVVSYLNEDNSDMNKVNTKLSRGDTN